MPEKTRAAKKMHLLLREQRFDFPDRRKLYGVCVWCGYPGGEGFQPYTQRAKKVPNWGAMDMHEWLFKRNRNLPKNITFSLENIVLLHTSCHAKYGQSKEMVKRCYEHKKKFYNLQKWVNEVVSQTNISPINLEKVYGGNMKVRSPLFVDVQTVFDDSYSDLFAVNYGFEITNEEERHTKPHLVKVVAFGYGFFDSNGKFMKKAIVDIPEKPIFPTYLARFWDMVRGDVLNIETKQRVFEVEPRPLVAYSFNGFTYPVLKAQTIKTPLDYRLKHGIKPVFLDKAPWKGNVLDVKYELMVNDGLDLIHGATVGKPKELCTGADIPRLYHEGGYNKIKQYSLSRLEYCSDLYLLGANIYWPDHLDIAQKKVQLQKKITNNLPPGF